MWRHPRLASALFLIAGCDPDPWTLEPWFDAPATTGHLATTGPDDTSSSGESSSTGPAVEPGPCVPWRTDLPAGFAPTMVRGLHDDGVVVGGQADGVPSVRFYDAAGDPTWSYAHAGAVDTPMQTTIVDAAAVGTSRLVAITRPELQQPGYIVLLDLETQDEVWNHYLDASYAGYPYYEDMPIISARAPLRVAAADDGTIAAVVRGSEFFDMLLTIGVDPATGSVLWNDHQDGHYAWSSALAFNGVGGWFVHVHSYAGFGSASFDTQRRNVVTGEEMPETGPSGSGSPGPVAGRAAMRSDGVLVVPTTISWAGPSQLSIRTRAPDGTSIGSVDLTPDAGRSASASTVDDADRVYMLLGIYAGDQSVLRFDVDLSWQTVMLPDASTVLRDLASTTADDLIVLGDDGAWFVERICTEP
ncbi:MAG: hypothetical protein ACE37F_27745 [Nannocystaceae bacterium]|nr:hypothetical protein [bacterium]